MTAPDPRVGEIEARLSAATPGPWRVRECPPCTERGRLEVNIWDEPGNLLITGWCDDDEFHRPDAEFIANAPTDLAYLLAELRKAHEALARVEGLADDLATQSDGRGLDYSDDDFDRGWHGANRAAVDQLRAAAAAAKGDGEQAYIVECEDLVPGDQIWFKNLSEAEETCGPFPSCCVPKPVGPDYDGPRWVPEDEESE